MLRPRMREPRRAETRSLNDQYWSENEGCFGCGRRNRSGLRLQMYERDGAVVATWRPRSAHQNWAGIVHGGVIAAALDEVSGAAAWLAFLRRDGEPPDMVTAELTMKFRTPVRVSHGYVCIATMTELNNRDALVGATLADDHVEVASATARYVKIAPTSGPS